MSRWVAWAAAAVAVAVLAWGAAAVWASLRGAAGLVGGGGEPATAAASPGTASGGSPGLLIPVLPPDAGAPGTVAPPTEEQKAQLLPPAEPGSWESTRLGARPRALGRAGLEVEQWLGEQQDELGRCFTRGGQAAFAGKPVTEVRAPSADDPGSPVLELYLESRSDGLQVADALVQARSTASEATLACLQDRLRGRRIPTEAPAPAPRFRLRVPVSP